MGELPGVKWGAVEQVDGGLRRRSIQDPGGQVYEETLRKDRSLERLNISTDERQVFNRDGARVYYGRHDGNNYVVETFDQYRPGVAKSKEVFTKAPSRGGVMLSSETKYANGETGLGKQEAGKWVETRNSPGKFSQTETFTGPGGRLLTREVTFADGSRQSEVYGPDGNLASRLRAKPDGQATEGKWEGGKWVERTTKSADFQSRTEVFQRPGGSLESRETTYKDGVNIKGTLEDGRWSEKATNLKELRYRIEVFDKAGEGRKLLARTTLDASGREIAGVAEKGGWVETTKGAEGIRSRREVFDKEGAGRTLLERQTIRDTGVRVEGKSQPTRVRDGGRWVEKVMWVEQDSASSDYHSQVSVYDKADGKLRSRHTSYKDGTYGVIQQWGDRQDVTTFTGKVEVQKNGDLKLQLASDIPGAPADGAYKIYRRVGDGWKLVSYKHQIPNPTKGSSGPAWVEETWSEDGKRYVQDVWNVRDHEGLAEDDGAHLATTVVEGGKATTTFYHARQFTGRDIPYMWGNYEKGAHDARVTYEHAVGADGKLGEMLKFTLVPDGRDDWRNTWDKQKIGDSGRGWDTWSGGWLYDKGNLEPPVDMGVAYHNGYVLGYQVKLNPDGGAEVADVERLPFLDLKSHQAKDGTFVETVYDRGHTQAVQLVYGGPDRKELLQRTVGHKENGAWVQATTRTKDLYAQVVDRLRSGGNKVDATWSPDGDMLYINVRSTTPEVPWTPPGVDRPPHKGFRHNYDGQGYLKFKKVSTADGVDQYILTDVSGGATHWTTRDGGANWSQNEAGLDRLGLTKEQLQPLLDRWNTRAVL